MRAGGPQTSTDGGGHGCSRAGPARLSAMPAQLDVRVHFRHTERVIRDLLIELGLLLT